MKAIYLFVIWCVLAHASFCVAQQPDSTSASRSTPVERQNTDAEIQLRDRIAKLEANEKALHQRIDDISRSISDRIEDLRNVFGGIIAFLTAIASAIVAAVIARERRERKELKELAASETERLTRAIRDLHDGLSQEWKRLEVSLQNTRAEFARETVTLRKGLIDGLRAHARTLQQQLEEYTVSKQEEMLETTPAMVAQRAMVRLKTQLEEYAKTLSGLNVAPEPIDHILRANFYLGQGEESSYRSAALEAQRALDLAPDNGEALVVLAQAQRHLGEVEESITALKRACSLDPNNTLAIVELVKSAMAAHQNELVLRSIEDLSSRDDFSDIAWLMTTKAAALRRLRREVEAANLLRDTLKDQPQNSIVRKELLEILLAMKLYDETARVAEEGLSINPADHQMRVYRARGLGGLERFDEAFEELAEAELKNPRDVKIYLTRSELFAKKGDYTEAAKAASAGLAMGFPPQVCNLLLVSLAKSLSHLGEWSGAVDAATRALTVGRQYLINNIVQTQCLFCAGRYAEARVAAEEGLDRFSYGVGRIIFVFFLALASLAEGQDENRIEELKTELVKLNQESQQKIELEFDFIRYCVETHTIDSQTKSGLGAIIDVLSP